MLYHYTKGFPMTVNLPSSIPVIYSNHAVQAAQTDRYGHIRLDEVIETKYAKVVELETDDRTGAPIKVLIRMPYEGNLDVCVAISLQAVKAGKFLVKTLWLNSKDDQHKTLNSNAYKAA